MNGLTLKWIALKIEFHWWRIRCLREKQTATSSYSIKLHRYQAEQLCSLYEIKAGIRDFNHRVILSR